MINWTETTAAVSKLRPYERNPRRISKESYARLLLSLKEMGYHQRIVCQPDMRVIGGHQRIKALKELGVKTVAILVPDRELTDAEYKRLLIQDNLPFGEFDADILSADFEVSDLIDWGMPDDMFPPLSTVEGQTDEDAGPEVPEAPENPVSKPGDLWKIGNHLLLCGDSTDVSAIARLMDGEQAALLFTSPPYGNQRDYTTGGIADWDALMRGVFGAMPMREDGQVLVNLGLIHKEGEWIPYWQSWLDWMRMQGWRRFGWYVWDQGPGLPGDWNGRFAPSFEFVFHFNKNSRKPNKIVPCKWAGHVKHDGAGGLRAKEGTVRKWTHAEQPIQAMRIPDNVIRVTRHKANGVETEHPAVFPVKLVSFVLEAYSDKNDICYEPFCGSGTSIIAAEQTGRRMRAVEIAPKYCDVTLKRCREWFPDISITLDGRDYESVAAERLAA